MLKLHIIQPGKPDQALTFERDWAVIGRKKERGVDVVIDQPFVSGKHALVLKGIVVIDQGSSNGTFVDGRRIEEPTVARDKSFTLGRDEVRILVEDDSAERTQPSASRPHSSAPKDAPRGATDAETAALRARVAKLEACLRGPLASPPADAPSVAADGENALAERLRALEGCVKEHEDTIGRLRAELESARGADR